MPCGSLRLIREMFHRQPFDDLRLIQPELMWEVAQQMLSASPHLIQERLGHRPFYDLLIQPEWMFGVESQTFCFRLLIQATFPPLSSADLLIRQESQLGAH